MHLNLESLDSNLNTVDEVYKSISWLNELICGYKNGLPLATVNGKIPSASPG